MQLCKKMVSKDKASHGEVIKWCNENNYKSSYSDKTRNDVRGRELFSQQVDTLKLIIAPEKLA